MEPPNVGVQTTLYGGKGHVGKATKMMAEYMAILVRWAAVPYPCLARVFPSKSHPLLLHIHTYIHTHTHTHTQMVWLLAPR